ncbi:MAG: YqgE/AlgH family protein [Rhodospirillaceae bacterium]|nr:YqgE/AlgH family protein [Rhodospirillaceae bacterium]
MAAKKPPVDSGYLVGQFLVAMPAMADPRFERSVIYLCAHSADGAMGLIVNKPLKDIKLPEILDQLGIEPKTPCDKIHIHRGGPVETARGFVLHSADYHQEGATLKVNSEICLSATTEILRAIASGEGPRKSLMALGYAGWGRGQLDEEIKQNAWLNVPGDDELLFSENFDQKWERVLAKIGVSPHLLSGVAGHA